MKIGPVDTEIALLIVKKEEITEGKIYSPDGRCAERVKLTISNQFLPRDALLSAVYAVVVCLSVCLCVCVCLSHSSIV